MGQTALEPTRLQRQFCIELVKNGGHNATAAYKAAAGPVLRAMSDDSLIQLIGEVRMQRLVCDLNR